jgi:hypothetical protein
MDATALLGMDHDTMRELFRRLGETLVPEQVCSLYRTLCRALREHMRSEEDVFHPAVMRVRSSEAKQAVRLALEAHQSLDGIMAEIDALDPEDPRFAERLSLLRQGVERHIEDDQGRMFTLARIHLTDERLEDLGRAMERSTLARHVSP